MNSVHHPDLKMDEPVSSLDLEQIQFIVRERSWLIALFGLIGIFAGLAYIQHTPLTYSAQAVLEVDPAPTRIEGYSDGQDNETRDPIGDVMGQTVVAVFRSRAFAQQVVTDNNLLKNPNFLPPSADGKPHTMDEAVSLLINTSHANIRMGTRLIDVGVTFTNPEMAQQLANMVAKGYVDMAIAQQNETATAGITFLEKQEADYGQKLADSKQAALDYERKTSSSLIEGQDTVVSELKAKQVQLSAAHTERIRLEGVDGQIQDQLKKTPDDWMALLAIPSVASDPTIVAVLHEVDKIQTSISVLKLRYTELNPKVIQVRTELADMQKQLLYALQKVPTLIHAQLENAINQEAKFQSEFDAQKAATDQLNSYDGPFEVLKNHEKIDQDLYDRFESQLKQAKVATGFESPGIHLFEPALEPTEPIQAKKSRTMAIATGAGIMLGLLLSIGLHILDSSLKTVDQAEQVLGLTALAAIPRSPQNKLKESSLAIVNAPDSPVAEAFRSLRTSLFLAGRNKGRKIILFTSALAGEGKTFCSTNYACALAQQGLKTLLIDADLRSPMVGNVLLKGDKLLGLSEVLSRQTGVDPAIHESGVPNLSIMPAGALVSNPAELLARADMAEVIRSLNSRFDRIVIDSAPVTAVSDTLLLLEHAQEACLVVHAGKTPRKWCVRAIKLIREAGSQPDGIIVNQVPLQMAAYSYYPGRYGDPGVYGANGKKVPAAEVPVVQL